MSTTAKTWSQRAADAERRLVKGTWSKLSHFVDDVWYPAWDSGDPEYFEQVTLEIWSPDGTCGRDGLPDLSFDDVMPIWLEEVITWCPQKHQMQNVIDPGGEFATWEYHWSARYSGNEKLPDGSEVPEDRRHFFHRAGVICSWDGHQITSIRASGAFGSHEVEMGIRPA